MGLFFFFGLKSFLPVAATGADCAAGLVWFRLDCSRLDFAAASSTRRFWISPSDLKMIFIWNINVSKAYLNFSLPLALMAASRLEIVFLSKNNKSKTMSIKENEVGIKHQP